MRKVIGALVLLTSLQYLPLDSLFPSPEISKRVKKLSQLKLTLLQNPYYEYSCEGQESLV
jgi:hypothetical protein